MSSSSFLTDDLHHLYTLLRTYELSTKQEIADMGGWTLNQVSYLVAAQRALASRGSHLFGWWTVAHAPRGRSRGRVWTVVTSQLDATLSSNDISSMMRGLKDTAGALATMSVNESQVLAMAASGAITPGQRTSLLKFSDSLKAVQVAAEGVATEFRSSDVADLLKNLEKTTV